MTRRLASIAVWLSVSVLALAACTDNATYWTPEGADTTLAGAWTIAGAAADMTSCAAASVTEVDLVFVHDGSDVVIGPFTFPCMQGAFDSRPTPALAAGTYVVHWRFLGGTDAGAISLDTDPVTIVAVAGGHVDVPPGDYAPPP